jgi:hypothetical protein
MAAFKAQPTPSELLAERIAVLAADTCSAADAEVALLALKEMLAQFPVDFSTGACPSPVKRERERERWRCWRSRRCSRSSPWTSPPVRAPAQ